MIFRRFVHPFSTHLSAILLLQPVYALAQRLEKGIIPPGREMVVDGVPPVPAELARLSWKYESRLRPRLAGWHPSKRELRLREGRYEIYYLSGPEQRSETVAKILPKVGQVYEFYFDPQGKSLVYNLQIGGDERYQMYFRDLETGADVALTDGKSRNVEPVWSRKGDRVAWGATPEGKEGTELVVVDPRRPDARKTVVALNGRYLKAEDWSPDDRELAYTEYLSDSNESRLWLVNVETGEKRQVAPQSDKVRAVHEAPAFSRDGGALYFITDQGSEFRRVARVDLKTLQTTFVTSGVGSDIEEFALSPDNRHIAAVSNEDGISRIRLIEYGAAAGKLPSPVELPEGIISRLMWHNNSTDLALKLESPNTPGDYYVVSARTGEAVLWKDSKNPALKPGEIVRPEVLHYKSFDGREISGLIYRAPSRFSGRRPVLVDIHGGPDDQARPSYFASDNVYPNDFGITRICPNVRGSTGYGKTFHRLDDGPRRGDSVKDIGALLDWIGKQPDLDASRVMVIGYSYGGYMALTVAATFGDRIRGAVSHYGISNIVTFLENTAGWRRDTRRAEYGDERDSRVRAVLDRSAPVNNASKITKPLLIAQGANDPRIPARDAELMASAAKKNEVPVWFILARNEGHGFTSPENQLYVEATTFLFIQRFLLEQPAGTP